jgi:hypothetical protein
VHLVPEQITPHPNDPALDESGILYVQLFDIPNPPKGAAGIDVVKLPIAAGKEISLDSLPTIHLKGKLSGTAYVLALFRDDNNAPKRGDITYGDWIGGLDISNGIKDGLPLDAIAAPVGQGTSVDVALTALRKLTVTVSRTATPVAGGDAQGPLAIAAIDSPDPSKKPNSNPPAKPGFFGLGSVPCADLATQSVDVTGFVLGNGPYWVFGSLDDLLAPNVPGKIQKGSLVSLDVTGGTATIPTRLDIAVGDYAPTAKIDLSYTVPLAADAGTPGPNSCADLPAATDGGATP